MLENNDCFFLFLSFQGYDISIAMGFLLLAFGMHQDAQVMHWWMIELYSTAIGDLDNNGKEKTRGVNQKIFNKMVNTANRASRESFHWTSVPSSTLKVFFSWDELILVTIRIRRILSLIMIQFATSNGLHLTSSSLFNQQLSIERQKIRFSFCEFKKASSWVNFVFEK